MKFGLRSLMMAIPLLTVAAGGQAVAAQEDFKQKNIICGGDDKKIVSVPNNRVPQILYIALSSSDASTVRVKFGGNRILQLYMDSNDSFQTSLAEIAGKAGQTIKVGCSGNGNLSVTVYYSLSVAP